MDAEGKNITHYWQSVKPVSRTIFLFTHHASQNRGPDLEVDRRSKGRQSGKGLHVSFPIVTPPAKFRNVHLLGRHLYILPGAAIMSVTDDVAKV